VSGDITQLLADWRNGDQKALDKLMPIVYGELHRLANAYMRSRPLNNTLQATALVNEAYLRLINKDVGWQNRSHFYAIAAQLMRDILVDYTRNRLAAKRGGGSYKVSLDDVSDLSDKRDVELLALDDALKSLAGIDPQKSRIIELRYFGGLSLEETAEVLDVSPSTVSREWKLAKIWLLHELKKQA
jgi:RNA polymerase sigma-70 factor, ECF subfamily